MGVYCGALQCVLSYEQNKISLEHEHELTELFERTPHFSVYGEKTLRACLQHQNYSVEEGKLRSLCSLKLLR